MRNKGNKKYWKAEADRLFSLYVRQRDADKNGYCTCPTCNKKFPWRYGDCGHFMSRANEATRFEELNASGQCKQCNGPRSGKQYEHGLSLDKKWGEGIANNMLVKSKMVCKRSWFDYYIIAEELKQKLIANSFIIK